MVKDRRLVRRASLLDSLRLAATPPRRPSGTAARCLVLLVMSTALAALLEHHDYRLRRLGRLDSGRPLPGTLSPFTLRSAVTRERLRHQGCMGSVASSAGSGACDCMK